MVVGRDGGGYPWSHVSLVPGPFWGWVCGEGVSMSRGWVCPGCGYGYQPPTPTSNTLVAAAKRTVGKRVVCFLLECFPV